MGFGSIEFTAISRSQDYTTIKQNEDNKSLQDQTNIGQQIQKQTQQLTKEVKDSGNSDWYNRQPDAKEKGHNEYAGDGGRKRKKQEQHEKMVVKGRSGFDIKV